MERIDTGAGTTSGTVDPSLGATRVADFCLPLNRLDSTRPRRSVTTSSSAWRTRDSDDTRPARPYTRHASTVTTIGVRSGLDRSATGASVHLSSPSRGSASTAPTSWPSTYESGSSPSCYWGVRLDHGVSTGSCRGLRVDRRFRRDTPGRLVLHSFLRGNRLVGSLVVSPDSIGVRRDVPLDVYGTPSTDLRSCDVWSEQPQLKVEGSKTNH